MSSTHSAARGHPISLNTVAVPRMPHSTPDSLHTVCPSAKLNLLRQTVDGRYHEYFGHIYAHPIKAGQENGNHHVRILPRDMRMGIRPTIEQAHSVCLDAVDEDPGP